jgi:hypothetical protein
MSNLSFGLPKVPLKKASSVGIIDARKSATPSMEAPIKYNNVQVLKQLISANQILDRWSEDRNRLATTFQTEDLSSNLLGATLSCDNRCMCHGGWGAAPFSSSQICVGCSVLLRLVPKTRIPETGLVKILVGSYAGSELQIRSSATEMVAYQHDPYSASMMEILTQKLRAVDSCDPGFLATISKSKIWSAGSNVTHYIAISSILQQIMLERGIPSIPPFRWAYGCANETFVVDEKFSLGIGNLESVISVPEYVDSPRTPMARSSPVIPLTRNVAGGILTQLIAILHLLAGHGFVHGEPSLSFLGFSAKKSYFEYDGVKIESPVTMHLIPSPKSSINLKRADGHHRLINRISPHMREITSMKIPVIESRAFLTTKTGVSGGAGTSERCQKPSSPVMAGSGFRSPCMEEIKQHQVMGYRIGDFKDVFASYVQNSGVPLFHLSFDVYAFMVSLMMEPSFYRAVHNDLRLKTIWSDLWFHSEYELVEAKLMELRHADDRKIASSKEILNFLAPLNLRCNALDYLWQSLKKV